MAQRQRWKPRGPNCAKRCLPEGPLWERCWAVGVGFHTTTVARVLCLWDGRPEGTGEAAPQSARLQEALFGSCSLFPLHTFRNGKKANTCRKAAGASACVVGAWLARHSWRIDVKSSTCSLRNPANASSAIQAGWATNRQHTLPYKGSQKEQSSG